MTRMKLILVSLLAALALVGAACGGDSDEVPADAIAVVDGNAIDKSEFDSLINQAKKSYELQKRDFPKVGSPEYNTLKNQAVQFLVQREQFEIKADELDVEVTDKQVDDRLTQIKKQYFQGSDKKYREQLKQQGLTEESVKRDIRAQLVQEGIFKKVTEETKVTDKEIQDYYNKNKAQYGTPEQREVRHILVPTKKQADDIYEQLQDGGDFAALAKKFSQGPGISVAGRQADDRPRPDRRAVRPHRVPAQGGPGLAAREDAVRLPHHRADRRHQAGRDDAAEGRQGVDPAAAAADEANEAMTTWVEDTKKDFAKDTSRTRSASSLPRPRRPPPAPPPRNG